MVQRRVLQCGLCRSKEKCLKPGLKCNNRWSSSTVQRKRVPEPQYCYKLSNYLSETGCPALSSHDIDELLDYIVFSDANQRVIILIDIKNKVEQSCISTCEHWPLVTASRRLIFIFFGVNCCYLPLSNSAHCRHGARLNYCIDSHSEKNKK